jgi:hypothetical protein
MSLSHPFIARLVVISLLLVPASWAQAGQLMPNPAIGTNAAPYAGSSTVTLINNATAYYQPQCTWLYAAATNAFPSPNPEPYNNKVSTTQWTFQYAPTFNGTFTLGGFVPKAVNPETGNPFVAADVAYQSTVSGPAGGKVATQGGAVFDISYAAGKNDPNGTNAGALGTNNGTNGTNVEWMQVIEINQVGWNALVKMGINGPGGSAAQSAYFVKGNGTNGVPTGSYAFLDNSGNTSLGGTVAPGTTPWYGWLSTTGASISTSLSANSNGFYDSISLPFIPGMVVQAQTFLASDNVNVNATTGITTNTVTIEGGVWWGFQDAVPEPSSWILLITGCGIVAIARRRALLDRFLTARQYRCIG